MNAPLHREIPSGLLDAERALSDVSSKWDQDIVKQITDYIAIPAKSPGFDKDWAQHGYLETVLQQRRQLGGGAEGRRPEAGDRAPRRPHAGALLRTAGDRHRHAGNRADVRPPRQAARVHRLAQRPRALDPEVRRRPAVRPRRRRRRLCGVCERRRAAGPQGTGRGASAHRRPDRDLRGIRLLRPAALRRRAAYASGRSGRS